MYYTDSTTGSGRPGGGGAVIGFDLLVALVSMLAGYFFAIKVASRYDPGTELEESYDDLKVKYGTLPGTLHSMLPLLVPIILIVPRKSQAEARSEWMGEGVKHAALILAITGAGGAFGRILQGSPMVPYIPAPMGYKLWTVSTGVQGVAAFLAVLVLSIFMQALPAGVRRGLRPPVPASRIPAPTGGQS